MHLQGCEALALRCWLSLPTRNLGDVLWSGISKDIRWNCLKEAKRGMKPERRILGLNPMSCEFPSRFVRGCGQAFHRRVVVRENGTAKGSGGFLILEAFDALAKLRHG